MTVQWFYCNNEPVTAEVSGTEPQWRSLRACDRDEMPSRRETEMPGVETRRDRNPVRCSHHEAFPE
ncbi:MAG: hypothetical protein IGR92_03680 [Leptolyngbyaceae cyanobacterium T60_A2020_046]|nr:hypothetical protein [Leptolyngbyaceae cyanobacterium T60_A2020_046]